MFCRARSSNAECLLTTAPTSAPAARIFAAPAGVASTTVSRQHHPKGNSPRDGVVLSVAGVPPVTLNITHIRLRNEFVYITVILVACSRRAIGWFAGPDPGGLTGSPLPSIWPNSLSIMSAETALLQPASPKPKEHGRKTTDSGAAQAGDPRSIRSLCDPTAPQVSPAHPQIFPPSAS
jgi:hypothetical protein